MYCVTIVNILFTSDVVIVLLDEFQCVIQTVIIIDVFRPCVNDIFWYRAKDFTAGHIKINPIGCGVADNEEEFIQPVIMT
nr:MAG TPA: hypothetical protein [Caudoviricetes sp.]